MAKSNLLLTPVCQIYSLSIIPFSSFVIREQIEHQPRLSFISYTENDKIVIDKKSFEAVMGILCGRINLFSDILWRKCPNFFKTFLHNNFCHRIFVTLLFYQKIHEYVAVINKSHAANFPFICGHLIFNNLIKLKYSISSLR